MSSRWIPIGARTWGEIKLNINGSRHACRTSHRSGPGNRAPTHVYITCIQYINMSILPSVFASHLSVLLLIIQQDLANHLTVRRSLHPFVRQIVQTSAFPSFFLSIRLSFILPFLRLPVPPSIGHLSIRPCFHLSFRMSLYEGVERLWGLALRGQAVLIQNGYGFAWCCCCCLLLLAAAVACLCQLL